MRYGGMVALLVAVLLALPACGGGDDSQPSASTEETQASDEPIDYTKDLGTECLEIEKGRVYEIRAGDPNAKDNFEAVTFKPDTIKAPAGKFITLEITNPDTTQHDFSSEGLDCGTEPLQKGDTVTVSFKVPRGETDFLCTFHKGFMTGNIIGTK